MNRTLIRLLCLSLLFGCATTMKDFRENKLAFVAQIPANHQALASCVMAKTEETENTRPDTMRLASYRNITWLTFSFDAPSGILTFMLSPQAELVFTQTGTDVLV